MRLHKYFCCHCGRSAAMLATYAMLLDAGCPTSVRPDTCDGRSDGGEHDFSRPRDTSGNPPLPTPPENPNDR